LRQCAIQCLNNLLLVFDDRLVDRRSWRLRTVPKVPKRNRSFKNRAERMVRSSYVNSDFSSDGFKAASNDLPKGAGPIETLAKIETNTSRMTLVWARGNGAVAYSFPSALGFFEANLNPLDTRIVEEHYSFQGFVVAPETQFFVCTAVHSCDVVSVTLRVIAVPSSPPIVRSLLPSRSRVLAGASDCNSACMERRT